MTPASGAKFVVVAPMVAARKKRSGLWVHVLRGNPMPAEVAESELARLAADGLIEQVSLPVGPEPWPPTETAFALVYPLLIPFAGNRLEPSSSPARLVLLWGQLVAVNDDGDIYCRLCRSFVPKPVLGDPTHDLEWRPEPARWFE